MANSSSSSKANPIKKTKPSEDDILLYYNHKNARMEFRQYVKGMVSKIVNGSKLKHELTAREMLGIVYEEFGNACAELEDVETEAEFCTLDENEGNGVFGF